MFTEEQLALTWFTNRLAKTIQTNLDEVMDSELLGGFWKKDEEMK